MVNLQELPLGRDGLQYVLSSLKGAGRFADALAAEVALIPTAAGNVIAPLPVGVALSRALDFDTGGIIQGPGAKSWLAARVAALCEAHGGGTFVAVDTVAAPSDPHVARRMVDKFFYDGRVQYFASCADWNESSLDGIHRAVASFLFIAAFTTYPLSMPGVPADHAVDDRLIARLAPGVQAVFISAYDQESFVVWQR
jgi:hypothetical protein